MAHHARSIGRGVLLLVGGAIAGAGLALLYAPQSGRRTRRDISLFTRRTDRKARRMVGDFSDSVSEMVDTVGDMAAAVLEKGKSMAVDVRKELLSAFEEGQERLRRQREKLERRLAA